MELIAHRALMDGPDAAVENHPDQIRRALAEGFGAEIDLWFVQGEKWVLGHDRPTYDVDLAFVQQPNLWIHCKDTRTYFELKALDGAFNYFFHDRDDIVLTSRGQVWTYFGKPHTLSPWSVAVMPEVNYTWDEIRELYDRKACLGICSDYVHRIGSWSAER